MPAHAAVGSGAPVSDQPAGAYALDGDTLIYQNVAGGLPTLDRYNLRTGARSEIATKGVSDALTVSGSRIAYTTSAGSLTLQGLDSAQSTDLVTGGVTVTPVLSGDKLIYARVNSRAPSALTAI